MSNKGNKSNAVPEGQGLLSVNKRYAWMMDKIATSFDLDEKKTPLVQKCFQDNIKRICGFLTDLSTPPKLFFFWQPRAFAHDELFISDGGDTEKLTKKCVYFIRDTARPVNLKSEQDNTVLCGELNPEILQSFHQYLDRVHIPILKDQADWGQIKQKKDQDEFLTDLEAFDADLKHKIDNLRGDIELKSPSEPYSGIEQKPASYAKAARDPKVLAHFEKIVESWCTEITNYIDTDPSKVPIDIKCEDGPNVEIGRWGRRMLSLISITEQLKTKPNRVVTGVLKARALLIDTSNPGKEAESKIEEQERIKALIEKWREVDLAITDALNEAKDNFRFLENLRKAIDLLYTGSPESITEMMPSLMNSMKMIHTLSRHYGTQTRMGNLFVMITNQLIARCKESIYAGSRPQELWQHPAGDVIQRMKSTLDLRTAYQESYRVCKDTLAQMENGKQFNFDEFAIFDKFDRFCHRLEKLMDMFSSIQQFKALEGKKLDGMTASIGTFDALISDFRIKSHDLLDYTHTQFERDFVEFTMKNSGLENSIQEFIQQSITRMGSIEKQLDLAHTLQSVLTRASLAEDLHTKVASIFAAYGKELKKISSQFEKNKDHPPIARNMTPYAGKILWARQLQRRISGPMRKFQRHPKLFQSREGVKKSESAKIVQAYNQLIKAVIKKETQWYHQWSSHTTRAKRRLSCRLIARNKTTGKLAVNFDPTILRLMKEAKHMSLLGFEIPRSARIVLLLETKVKAYFHEITDVLTIHERVTNMIPNELKALMKTHLADLDLTFRPALTAMTWTSMHIDQFLIKARAILGRFEFLMIQVNDVVTNRIEKNLVYLSNMLYLILPEQKTYTLRAFEEVQRDQIAKVTEVITAKNIEVERALDDLVMAVMNYDLHPSLPKPEKFEVNCIKRHYSHVMFNTLLHATKNTIDRLRTRLEIRPGDAAVAPLFDVEVSLNVQEVIMTPSLNDIHKCINFVAREATQVTRKVMDWGFDECSRPCTSKPFLDPLSKNKDLAICLLLLKGAVHNAKERSNENLLAFREYSWLWTEDVEETYARFLTTNPILEDIIAELHRFGTVEAKIDTFTLSTHMGCVSVKVGTLQAQLKHEVQRWKGQYSKKLHNEVKVDMEAINEEMQELQSRLDVKLKDGDFVSLTFLMDAMARVRDVQSSIDQQFQSINERYNTLENYLPLGAMSKDEMDTKSTLTKRWNNILERVVAKTGEVNAEQEGFKQVLMDNVREFRSVVDNFNEDYKANGPTVPGTLPAEAITRLSKYKREFETIMRKFDLYRGGELLFGLRPKEYPILKKTTNELRLLVQLYDLYSDVIKTSDDYKQIPWAEVVANIGGMNDKFESFNDKAKRLPKGLRSWQAAQELKENIENFIELLPLLQELSKPSMRDRHWEEISELTGTEFDPAKFNDLKLKTVLDANLLSKQDEIEEITEAAEKQLGIEEKLKEIEKYWEVKDFEFGVWKERGEVTLNGVVYAEIVEMLEESQSSLVQMVTAKHNKPFKPKLDAWLNKLSDVNDTLDRWVRVQQSWMALEAVFTAGDIARQLPQDTRTFMKVDKEWTSRLMNKAKDVRNVIDCCQDEYIKNLLPIMSQDLERCQKALDGYLEQKRGKFPRFYFVSNAALLLILSQGSDRERVQDCFSKVFDSIDRVEFQGNNITKMKNLKSGKKGAMDMEEVPLKKPVNVGKSNIEDWLNQLRKEMMRTLKNVIRSAAADCEVLSDAEMITKYIGQACLLGVQFKWTTEVTEALQHSKHKSSALPEALARQRGVSNRLSAMTTEEIPTKMERTKIETLVTIQVHQVDVLIDLVKRKIKDIWDFEWQKQLRCYWSLEDDECYIKIADFPFAYCYEYLGCKERLVVTPLTDRAYISLTQAVGMFFGGAPAGPAGTGKTETVKDLGRALGKIVVVFNCSDQMHTPDTAKIYKGICQSGSWGCFDEFNRINLDVLSVVAQQVEAIFTAMRAGESYFVFPGDNDDQVLLDNRCGIFITMNPGYAGRQELPENLKALFRSIAMMVPDRGIIMKVKLASVGYLDYQPLSLKFQVLYKLCEEQLSQQRHYDFGLRNILSVLRTAGTNLRLKLQVGVVGSRANTEEMLMMQTLRDMNLAKFVADDVPLFNSLLKDLFPDQPEPEKKSYDEEEAAMLEVIEEMGLIDHPSWMIKIVQLFATSMVRHGLMMVGPAGGGKTKATEVLMKALTKTGVKHQLSTLNPKAITAEQMFGQNDLVSGEWTDGIFSMAWSTYNDLSKPNTYICCDGPVDAIWIENLNTVLDDNQLLTLANGDRLPMTANVRALFEVQDLRNASPATVSRAGIIYVSSTDLGHIPIVKAWIKSRRPEEGKLIETILEKYMPWDDEDNNLVDYIRFELKNTLTVTDAHVCTNMLALMDSMLIKAVESQQILESEQYERLVIYCMTWSLGALLGAGDRKKFHDRVLSVCGPEMCPEFDAEEEEMVYDIFVGENYEWQKWLNHTEEYEFEPETFKFSTCLIPTVNSVRSSYLISLAERIKRPVLITGGSGTAKTSTALQYAESDYFGEMGLKKFNFSSATTHNMFQFVIESGVERTRGRNFSPPGGRVDTYILDDMSMPEVNNWGDQPTLEIVRQLVEFGGFYSLEKDIRGTFDVISKLRFIACMNHPGGGRNDIPSRLKRHYMAFNLTSPSTQTIDMIYGAMLRGYFDPVPSLVDSVSDLTSATISLWTEMLEKMLPTPSKFHYIFTMRDLSRIFQGILFPPLDVLRDDPTRIISLWLHECERVLCDKLTNVKDQNMFKRTARRLLEETWGDSVATNYSDWADSKVNIYFVDFLRDEVLDPETDEVLEEAPQIYELAPALEQLNTRCNMFLNKHNEENPNRQMPLVLFEDALGHMIRVSRIIGRPRSSALLVGVGGSGRQSLSRLATYIARQESFRITLFRGYKDADFRLDMRKVYEMVGKDGKKCTWIIADFELVFEDMLEYINAILMTGEVAGLFEKDEISMLISDLRGPAKKENPDFVENTENLYKYFVDRIRDNLHIVLCFSPANEKFAERARKFPGLISGCSIDWFLPWPEDALQAVSTKFVEQDETFHISCTPQVKHSLVNYVAQVHKIVGDACEDYFESYRRRVHVTPKSYLSFIDSYKKTYDRKFQELGIQQRKINTGLDKLKEAEDGVDRMKVALGVQQKELAVANEEAGRMLKLVEAGTKEANIKKAEADDIKAKCQATADIINEEKRQANIELQAAMPFVHAANKAASQVNKGNIGIIQKLANPPDLIKQIMDAVMILQIKPLEKVKAKMMKIGILFIEDSYVNAKLYMNQKEFVTDVTTFAAEGGPKDAINEETMELLEPYINLEEFNPVRCKKACEAAVPLLNWCVAMFGYHKASLVVGPKLEQLQIKTALFEQANKKLAEAEASSKAAQDKVDELNKTFKATMETQQNLKVEAQRTQDKMTAANNLIRNLGGEKVRWAADQKRFAILEEQLVGDVAIACAFVSYLGPFGFQYRQMMMTKKFVPSCKGFSIPVSDNMQLTKFLVDEATIARWNSQGLPKDELSIQNGILVTQASRAPLLIDPQSQAVTWLKQRYHSNLKVTTLNHKKLRDDLEYTMGEGEPMLIEGIVKDLDPMFDNILGRELTKKGKRYLLQFGDKVITFKLSFQLFLITNIANPTFSPELSAKTTIIDFSVTQKGLEDQLLSRVIQHEETALEEQRQKLVEEMNADTIELQNLDAKLLLKLSESSGDILEDLELIQVLTNTKLKSEEVAVKIEASKNNEKVINKKREQYRPVATRGSVVYFVMTSMSLVNVMYQTSLAMYLTWFDASMRDAAVDALVATRVKNLMDFLTFLCYQNIDRSLFEKDKLVFKLMMTMKVLNTEQPDKMTTPMINVLLQAGKMLNDQPPKCSWSWMKDGPWRNLGALVQEMDFFGDLKSTIDQAQDDWEEWYNYENPEAQPVPRLEERLAAHPAGAFMKFLLVRSLRDDRTRLAANDFIASAMGRDYVEPFASTMQDIWADTAADLPCILLLTPGADPTTSLQELAKRKGLKIHSCSMGEGQEPMAMRCIYRGMEEGNWALLQNCHLGLDFMKGIEDLMADARETKEVNDAFRVWITCEPHPDFPVSLLQSSVKVTNEPPAGLKAGLFRSYTNQIDAQRLNRVEAQIWRDLVFVLSFTHSVVQERRKFGAVGWCIPYEFNQSDLEASLTFMETHCSSVRDTVSWPTIQYMICEVQYGGRITDDFDRRLFNAYGRLWLIDKSHDPMMTNVGHDFKYKIPEKDQPHDAYVKYISRFPAHDSPEIFGLHNNADLTFGTFEGEYILGTISDTQPKESGASGDGLTVEQKVVMKANELEALMPEDYDMVRVRREVRKRPRGETARVIATREPTEEEATNGFSVPLNVTLFQEIECMDRTIRNVRATLRDLKLGIKGEIIMTPQLQDALSAVSNGTPPVHWYRDASGAAIAWQLPSLGLWFDGLLKREVQCTSWLREGRPYVFWLTGFFNPQGFLTAMRQEVTRRQWRQKWALDDVVLFSKVTPHFTEKKLKAGQKKEEKNKDGLHIEGLFIEGAKLNGDRVLTESVPKELFTAVPIIYITAITSDASRKYYSGAKVYDCPVYTLKNRTDLNYVCALKLKAGDQTPDHWVLRGVALLCAKD